MSGSPKPQESFRNVRKVLGKSMSSLGSFLDFHLAGFWYITAPMCTLWVVDFEESAKKSYVCLQNCCISLDFTHFDVRGKLHSLWVKICWSWNSYNRNIVPGQAESIAGDWLTWWRIIFRNFCQKNIKNIFKNFDFFRKIFSFFRFRKSENLSKNRKIEKIENFRKFAKIEIWKMKTYPENFQNFWKYFLIFFLANVSKYDPSSRYPISRDEFRTTATIFRVF